ncbi:hypothetical protein [Streptomyces hygroscopicus]|nr:hypothetical protein [Streptomyces hygroscopicus]
MAGQADFRATIGGRLPLVVGIVLVLVFLLAVGRGCPPPPA